jgi:hypothetical protein
MVNTTVRGIPDEVYDRLRRQAEREHRSINAQIVYVLERATEAMS